ncbi:hypothetical protein [Kitasatospora sp. NPDC057223]|uniref:hypothetical protein n=1 Tax=Kitasatospora sp. NPDC057223 TaxID=3346055 RepID=UPI00363907B6
MDGVRLPPSAHRTEQAPQQPLRRLRPGQPDCPVRQAVPANTELSYLYTPGTDPLTFDIDGIRFGAALCIEANFPALFAEYERLDVDCVLLSVMVDDAARAGVAQAYGTLYNYWLG